ncbi:hypothetical protein NDN08_007518 [Rhodosorus marinus]|uniref:dUTP diphosphatase n=1 Tax=Rhodosorus marinus TaxID=101924 RepID=A0AAV8V3I3_9RHOD|nr:hypothetical protein NDN08_007518 [Rhodosorus marinus]
MFLTDVLVADGGLQQSSGSVDVEELFGGSEKLRFPKTTLSATNEDSNMDFDEGLMSTIDSPEKAYLLGWIVDGLGAEPDLKDPTLEVQIHTQPEDMETLLVLRSVYREDVSVEVPTPRPGKDVQASFSILSRQMIVDSCKHLGVSAGEQATLRFPRFDDEALLWAFIRGLVESSGRINDFQEGGTAECYVQHGSQKLLSEMVAKIEIPVHTTEEGFCFKGVNCIDFLGKMYDNCGNYKLERLHNKFRAWLKCVPASGETIQLPECLVYRVDENAILPSKSKESDVGYDLSVIKEAKKLRGNVSLYDTGVRVRVSHGLYAEIVPRSSLSKSGYMMANSVGIIDPSYNGNLLVALVKVDPEAPEVTFPFRCCQLIFRQQVHVNVNEVDTMFDATERGAGGFGSTGK